MTNQEVTIKGKTFRMDGYLVQNFTLAKQVIKNDWDFIYVVDGEEGCGKSAFAQQMAYFLTEGEFGIEDVVFSVEDFKKRVREQKPYRAVIWDEAFVGMDSRSTLSKVNKEITRLLMECRQKNLFIFIVMPTWWDLSKYATLHRARGVFHVHTNEKLHRGYFRYYKRAAIRTMFLQSAKLKYSHPAKYKSFYGRFPKGYMVDEEEYRKKKDLSFNSEIEQATPDNPIGKTSDMWKPAFLKSIKFMKTYFGFTYADMGEDFGINPSTIRNDVRLLADWEVDNCHIAAEIKKMKGDTTL